MAFALRPLPYDTTALQPYMSSETLEFHHGKHHQAYVDKVNGWIDEKALTDKSLVEVIRTAHRQDAALFNNAAQIWNHNFFWSCLAPAGQAPSGELSSLIEAGFGSTEALLEKMVKEAVGHFASGWAWLILEGGVLKVTSYHDADTPVVHDGVKPLLTLDVWEHAYYIDYRNARPEYAAKVLGNIIDWAFVASNLDGEGVSRADQHQE